MNRREERISSQQKELLVVFMENHLNFAQGKFVGVEGRINHAKLWEELTKLLNDLEGANKNIIKWQKAWTDLKNKTKKKAAEIHGSRAQTGGGPPTNMKLTDVEERIIHLMSKEAVFGIEGPDNLPLEGGVLIAPDTETEPLPSTSTATDVLPKTELPEQEQLEDVELLESTPPSTPSSTSSTQSRRKRGRSTAEVAVENFTHISSTLNDYVQEISSTLKEIVEEKRTTNVLLQEVVEEKRSTNLLLKQLIEAFKDK